MKRELIVPDENRTGTGRTFLINTQPFWPRAGHVFGYDVCINTFDGASFYYDGFGLQSDKEAERVVSRLHCRCASRQAVSVADPLAASRQWHAIACYCLLLQTCRPRRLPARTAGSGVVRLAVQVFLLSFASKN
ncbi:hypothetical protein ACJJTC_007569 [Scirpophaga incertulas]